MVYVIMRSRGEVQLARQREELAAARAALDVQKQVLEQSLQNAGDLARNKAMDDFLTDIRVEERHYTRQHKALFLTRTSLVRQERIYFRNIPLTSWVEQEVPLEEGMDAESLAQTMSILSGELAPRAGDRTIRRLGRQPH